MPGTFCDTDELIELSKIVKQYPDTVYTSYMRGYSATSVEAVEELGRLRSKSGAEDNAALFDENPGYSSGVEHVLINGELVLEGTRHNDVLPAMLIRNAG